MRMVTGEEVRNDEKPIEKGQKGSEESQGRGMGEMESRWDSSSVKLRFIFFVTELKSVSVLELEFVCSRK